MRMPWQAAIGRPDQGWIGSETANGKKRKANEISDNGVPGNVGGEGEGT